MAAVAVVAGSVVAGLAVIGAAYVVRPTRGRYRAGDL